MLQQENDPSALGFQCTDLSENLIPLQLQECCCLIYPGSKSNFTRICGENGNFAGKTG